ncbi:ABC protein [Punctularia strigosozonata HHB-11173 SS5]|uniref:ABC protein n=1 Tax=Punctularia strigosozonata (strain HHB-11173) TaxID=741275 RepID=R7S3H1_PUNST|nr:ABC protein [Punctularia strigosozonata HHB-11173 SS5]EIN03766.1 ABC protein [Punctularia strigosozonata HHB-11173 SS5]
MFGKGKDKGQTTTSDEKLREVDSQEKDGGRDASLDTKHTRVDEGKNTQTPGNMKTNVFLDTGDVRLKVREHWWQIWRPADPPPPPPASLDDASIIPLANASFLSKITYAWISPMMVLGYQRTLQATDLWRIDDERSAEVLSRKLDQSWARRKKVAAEYNSKLAAGEIKPSAWKRVTWSVKALKGGKGSYGDRRKALEIKWQEVDGRKDPSLAYALNDVFGLSFWLAGVFKVFGDTSQLMSPLLIRAIINFGKARIMARDGDGPPPSVGRGVGMALGLWILTICASIGQHQFFWRSMMTGVLARSALIASIYRRGVNLTGKARTKLPNAALVNHISTDVSRIDAAAQWFHAGWTAPVQVSICLIILCVQLGPSALAGFALFALVAPMQTHIMSMQFKIRRKTNVWTDQRAKLLLEVLSSMRIVKYFTYEVPFLNRIFSIRHNELKGVRRIQFLRSLNIATAFSVPALAATLAFLTYTLTAHNFNEAIIFSSLSLFNLLRQPLMLMPRALSAISDARNALGRLRVVFDAEILSDDPIVIDPNMAAALEVVDATFEWEESMAVKEAKEKSAKEKGKGKRGGGGDKSGAATPAAVTGNKPFQMRDVNMSVPRGSLVAIVGPVGSGKSSLLQGLIGEMRKLKGDVKFGGRVGYCPQTAWIQNATLRDNIVFGQAWDEDRYWEAIENASLVADLQVLPDGDLTEIGEKGINLSGGQKQRVNIARALYFDADVVVFDDPLSAVDAHVGRALFNDAIIGSLRARGKSVILVTHALHFMSQCDYIYTVANGTIVEQGTYDELIAADGEFARLDKEFGGAEHDAEEAGDEEAAIEGDAKNTGNGYALEQAKQKSQKRSGAGSGKLEGRLIVAEKRVTGSVPWRVYWEYFKAGQGYWTGPFILFCMIIMQGSQIMNSYTLVWWQANTFNRPISFYQIIYGCLAISQATFTFLLGVFMDVMSFHVSQNLHHHALQNLFYAPMSLFDTTPLGRILSVFGKDIDTVDDQLAVSMRMTVITITSAIGAIVIISILEHYFLIAAAFIAFGYNYFASFYRASAREMKRLDSMLRSLLYGHFSESLTGIPTIRSYKEIPRFIRENTYYIDLENRALFLTVTNQRWLAIRLDFCGGMMIFVIAMLVVNAVNGINAAQIGLVLTYTTQLTQIFGMVTRQSAEVENYMNSVERVVGYSRSDLIEQEAPHEKPDVKPPPEWPTEGSIEFKDIRMSYRKGLPDVLKGITMKINGGEKIGVVGRTGAGKSSLMLALFRIVELNTGSITLDGIDISAIGLNDLRRKIAIIPQDPLLFSGTIRSNLDPFNLYDDAHLWDALRRSYLIETPTLPESEKAALLDEDAGVRTPQSRRFNLETVVESEGANLSVGERSLLSLARALVKDSKVVVLDEATASVDLETDAKIQKTISTEFSDRTLLCIAHRLRTIIHYDRILVMDQGQIAELDTPMNLFLKKDSIFRGMCDGSNITMEEMERAEAQRPHERLHAYVYGSVDNS